MENPERKSYFKTILWPGIKRTKQILKDLVGQNTV